MKNDEARMTNDERSPNDEELRAAIPRFGFRHCFVLRHSSFVI
jgi:hypothetical protein